MQAVVLGRVENRVAGVPADDVSSIGLAIFDTTYEPGANRDAWLPLAAVDSRQGQGVRLARAILRSFPQLLPRLLSVAVLLSSGCAYFNTFYNARQAYQQGVTFKEQGQQMQAKAKFEKAIEKSAMVIKRWPKSQWVDDALLLIGLAYYQQTLYPKAIRHFDQLALAFPDSKLLPEAGLYRGLALLADKQYGPARVALDNVKQRYPRLADVAAFHLARSLAEREEREAAIESLTAFVRRYPRSRYRTEATRLLAEQTAALGRHSDAEHWYREYGRLTTAPRERAAANLKVALARLQQGRPTEAATMAQDVLGRFRDLDDEAYLVLGRAQAESGQPDQAIGSWGMVRGNNDLGAEAAFRIARHFEENGEFDRARAYYDTARIRKAGSDYGVQAVKRLSLLDAFAGQQAGGREPAEAAFLLAEVHNLNLGDYDRAMVLYQAVRDSFPESDWAAKALFAKAWILRVAKKDTAAAEPVLRQVINEYPETEYADEARRWLGLPVPKRAKRVATALPADTAKAPPADTVAASPTPKPEPQSSMPGKETELLQERGGERPGPDQPAPKRGQPPRPEPRADSKLPGMVLPPGQLSAPEPELRAETPSRTERPTVDSGATASTLPASDNRSELALPTVYFGTDSAAVRPSDSLLLSEVVPRLLASAGRIVITGHCDPRASERYNEVLGLRRAEAVRDLLIGAGIAAERIVVQSRGELERVSSGPADYWRDRRVVLALE